MKIEVHDGIVKGLPLAILLTLLIHGATAVWWVSAKARDGIFVERRVERLEEAAASASSAQGQTLERLARIEERLSAQTLVLGRLEKQLLENPR